MTDPCGNEECTQLRAALSMTEALRFEMLQQALNDIDSLHQDLRYAWSIVRNDAYDSPGHVSLAIRPVLKAILIRHGIPLET